MTDSPSKSSQLISIFDAYILISLIIDFDWGLHLTNNTDTAAALILVPIEFGIWVAKIFFFGFLFVNIAIAIYLSFRANPKLQKLVLFGSPVFFIALIGQIYIWYRAFFGLLQDNFSERYVDFLWLFELAAKNGTGISPKSELGLSHFSSHSTGYFLIYLILTIYAVEKYFLRTVRIRWSVPIFPLILIATIVAIPTLGKIHQHEFVAAADWKVLSSRLTWPHAIQQCDSTGQGWQLPTSRELSLFLNSKPQVFESGAAWTSSLADTGESAVTVSLLGRQSGHWQYSSDFNRDEAFCESDDRPNQKRLRDSFTDLKPFFCRHFNSPILHVANKTMLAIRHGSDPWIETNLLTVCINRNNKTGILRAQHDYWKEDEFTNYSDYEAFEKNKCRDFPGAVSCELYFSRTGDTKHLNEGLEAQCNNHESDACYSLMRKAQKENQTKIVWDLTLKICEFGRPVQCNDSARVAAFSANPALAELLYHKYCEKLKFSDLTGCLKSFESSLTISRELETLLNDLKDQKKISTFTYFSEALVEARNNCDIKNDGSSCYVVGRLMQQARQADLAKNYYHLGCLNHDDRSCKNE